MDSQKGIAVFDADKTLWGDDVGEAFLRWLIAHRKLINVDYHQDIYAQYEAKLEQDRESAYVWAVSIMAGLPEEKIKQWAADFFKTHFVKRIYTPQKELISQLQQKNIPVWIVSASNKWIVEAGAVWLGIPATQVIGIDLVVEQGVLTNTVKKPVTYREGKITALRNYTIEPILFASGDSLGDQQLLENASKMALLITHNPAQNDKIAMLAHEYKWNMQYFPLLED